VGGLAVLCPKSRDGWKGKDLIMSKRGESLLARAPTPARRKSGGKVSEWSKTQNDTSCRKKEVRRKKRGKGGGGRLPIAEPMGPGLILSCAWWKRGLRRSEHLIEYFRGENNGTEREGGLADIHQGDQQLRKRRRKD